MTTKLKVMWLARALLWIAAAAAAASAVAAASAAKTHETKHWGVRVVAVYPHDPEAFTEGLLIHAGQLYESTGLNGHSSLRRVDLKTGKVEQIKRMSSLFFGEGIAVLGEHIYQLTWKNHTGFIHDLASFKRTGQFHYTGEGWGLTDDGIHLIASDGSATLRVYDPDNFTVIRRIHVHDGSQPVSQLNELEYIDGQIWANIWYEDRIARIAPETGEVLGWVDISAVYQGAGRGKDDVANGIAYDARTGAIYITGKDWPHLYQVKLVPKSQPKP